MYNLGQLLRDRLDEDYLDNNYNSDDLYAFSIDNYYSKESLELVLAGIYPPTDDLLWNPYIHWSPIAIDSLPKDLDILNYSQECPK